MNSGKNLFREEAIQANQVNWTGKIILAQPMSFSFLITIAVAISLILVAFSIWGSYTRRNTVNGQLTPEKGLIKVYTPESGTVLEKFVVDGQKVHVGDVLYTLSTTKYDTHGDIQEEINRQISSRNQSLEDEKNKYKLLHDGERQDLINKTASLERELLEVKSLIEGQRERIALAEDTLQRYQSLLNQEFISKEQVQQKKEELLDQRSRLEGSERDLISLTRELRSQQIALSGLSTKQQNEVASLNRQIAGTQQELTESKSKQKLVIRANQIGIATAVSAELAQQVDSSKPMLSIIPDNTQLIAELYVPSSAIGFIRTDNKVLLRYQAYPYQKFGHAQGKIISIAKTSLSLREVNNAVNFDSGQSSQVYLVKVRLKKQTILAYGQQQPLHVGMVLEADIMSEKRRIYEWILEPLYSITGKY